MFGFPMTFWFHWFVWPIGWIGITFIWAYYERKKEIEEDKWIAEEIKKGNL